MSEGVADFCPYCGALMAQDKIVPPTPLATTMRNLDAALDRIATLEAALAAICDHKGCTLRSEDRGDQYAVGVTDGHRTAAVLARHAIGAR